jgi:hypothetical protein
MKPISYFEFDRKTFLKKIRSRFCHYIIISKLFKTKNDKAARLNYDKILSLINITLRNKKTFDTNNIFYVLYVINEYHNFMISFSNNIKTHNEIETLKDIQIEFFNRQVILEELFKKNLEKPDVIDLNEIK